LLGEDAITLADPRGARIGDVNGDGAADAVLVLDGVFHVFQNLAADQDVLVGVSDGMNDHAPDDPEIVPNVSILYGHLVDTSITSGAIPGDPALESALYLSRADPANPCEYPRRCVVGPRRVVSGYAVNDGSGGVRRFSIDYEDGRYDRRGPGFVHFAKRTITDLDTLAGSAEFYDNVTFDEALGVYPFAGQVVRQWRWSPGLPDQPKPDQIEISFLDITPTLVPTNGEKTYFVIPTQGRLLRVEGVYAPGGPTLEAYVREVESSGGAKVLRDTTSKVTGFDAFGHVLTEELSTVGVDLTFHVARTYKNDTERWVLGQLQTQKECSSAAKLSQCRTLTRTTTIYGEVETESMETDDGSPEMKLKITYGRDDGGSITGITAEDGFGHIRSSTITYDPEGIYPASHENAAGHTSFIDFDARFGLLTKHTDPNGLVAERKFDRFGRLAFERRPDGTETSISLSRVKDASGIFRVTQRTTTSGGADDTAVFDSAGRPIRWFWHGPSPKSSAGEPPRLMQEVTYDPRSGKVARRSVPVSEGTAAGEVLFDEYKYDAVGREVLHTTPWKATVQTSYEGLLVRVTDPLKNVTTTELDPLGSPVAITDAAKGLTSYVYGPFGFLYSVTDPGSPADPSGSITVTKRDALGRVREFDDPDRGKTFQVWNGWGELLSSKDALGRSSTFERDAGGRMKSRVDKQNGAPPLTTTWTWDTAANGLGKLHKLTSPDGEKTYRYNNLGQLEGLTLAVNGTDAILEGKLGYDQFSRVATITYPTPAGAAPFVITQDFDPYGHVLKVHDDVTAYWHLTGVDNAGRFREEVFGNDVLTERSYFPDKQRLESIVTQGATTVQSLAYDYDARLSLKSRSDWLQTQNKTERFRYDALDRVTCAYFSANEDPFAPCASSYGYAPNGNLTFKSDVGVLSYDDPAHPHAVTSAGGDSFVYDAIGNQASRPGGVNVTYTPFDLPKTISQGATSITFGYDGDEKRIRKTTPDKETLYFEDLYERVTIKKPALKTEHRYFVHSPERVVAVVTRGGDKPGALYVHADNLGSVDVLTNEAGGVEERRSYDVFGQRRNPVWGQLPPASFASKTTMGFTGHESDDELGLVNMKGRLFDPKLGRFITTDPIISDLYDGQSLNAYTYVKNNPLAFVDPTGFSGEPAELLPGPNTQIGADGELEIVIRAQPKEKETNDTASAAEAGAAAPPTDVDTTGSSPEYDPHAETTAPDDGAQEFEEDWTQHSLVQVEGGFLGGVGLGMVPFGGAIANAITNPGTRWAEIGKGVGEIFGGGFAFAAGVAGVMGGGAASGTGVLTLPGVGVVVGSAALAAGGIVNVKAGAERLGQALSMSSGSGSGPKATPFPRKSLRGVSLKWLNRNKPPGWTKTPTRDYEGWIWRDENGVERLRFMRSNRQNPVASQWSRQANGYFRWKDANGNFLDIDGNVLRQGEEGFEEASHIMYEGPL
jgi:RHS repeat-associated protein